MNEYHGLNSYISGKINSQNQKTVWKLANCRDIRDLLLESQLRSVCSLDWNSANQAHDSAPFSLSNSNRRFSGLSKLTTKLTKDWYEHLQSWIWTLPLCYRAGQSYYTQIQLGGAYSFRLTTFIGRGLQLSAFPAYNFHWAGLQLSASRLTAFIGQLSASRLTTFIGRGLQLFASYNFHWAGLTTSGPWAACGLQLTTLIGRRRPDES